MSLLKSEDKEACDFPTMNVILFKFILTSAWALSGCLGYEEGGGGGEGGGGREEGAEDLPPNLLRILK